jgi:hypothetical protein
MGLDQALDSRVWLKAFCDKIGISVSPGFPMSCKTSDLKKVTPEHGMITDMGIGISIHFFHFHSSLRISSSSTSTEEQAIYQRLSGWGIGWKLLK